MGRLLQSSIRVEGELVAKTPVHSGGPGENVFSDLPLAVDGNGTVYFPGTGIAGPLRAWWRRAAEPGLADSVWGRVESEPGSNKGWASILLVHDAPLLETIDLDLAQHVAISPETGTAVGKLKFDRELVPVQARFGLSLELQRPACTYGPDKKMDDTCWGEVKGLLRGMLEDLERGAIRFGADKSRGRGVLRLENIRISSRDLASGILDTLRSNPLSRNSGATLRAGSESAANAGVHNANGAAHADVDDRTAGKDPIGDFFGNDIESVRPRNGLIELTLECQPVAPIMQRHEAEGTAIDMLPAVAVDGRERKPFLSGTGIKGAFRAQSERILRTVLDLDDTTNDRLDLIVALYGAQAQKTKKAHHAPSPADPRYFQSGRGAVNFDDCRLDRGLSLDKWRRLLTFRADKKEESLPKFRGEMKGTPWEGFTPAALVAIDRWTGGAADKFLFSRLEPDLQLITLSASIHVERIAPPLEFWNRFPSQPSGQSRSHPSEKRDVPAERCALASFRRAALALFLLTLRDFARGRIPLGYGVNRGLGDLDLCKATLSGWSEPGSEVHDTADARAEADSDPEDAADNPRIGAEFSLEAQGIESKVIELSKTDFDHREIMEQFQPLQEAWASYLRRKRNPETASDA